MGVNLELNPFHQLLPGIPIRNPLLDPIHDAVAKKEKVHLSKICTTAGWHGSDLRVAMAVAMAESRGDPEADNGTCCHCLFQIHRDWAGKNGAPSDPDKFFEWLNDPYNCAKFAHWIWTNNHHTFAGQWETFDTGAYRRFLGQDPLITVGQRIPIVDDVSDAVDTVTKTIPQFIAALFDPSTYLRIGKGFLGGIFIIIGLASLVFIVANRAINTNPVRNARKLATA